MDYYEELGIGPTATEEEIRKAHRRLTKLLHPDQQTDESMKRLAETQMRRLNSIVEILCDPQRRQEYDEQLRDEADAFSSSSLTYRPAQPKKGQQLRRSIPWWILSTAGAIALTVGAVWFWADNWGSSFGNHAPVYIPATSADGDTPVKRAAAPPDRKATETAKQESAPAPAPTVAPPEPAREAVPHFDSRTVATVPAPERPTRATSRTTAVAVNKPPAHPDNVAPVAEEQRKTLNLSNTQISVRPQAVNMQIPPAPNVPAAAAVRSEPAPLPAVALPVVTAKPPAPPAPTKVNYVPTAPKAVSHQDPLEGEWVYAPTAPEKRKAGFYPPEYIDLKLFWSGNGLHGQYRARYQVTNRPISPDVNFTLSPANGAHRFNWESNNGSRGTLTISSIDPGSIRIEWRTTVFSHHASLTAGTATLVRRTP